MTSIEQIARICFYTAGGYLLGDSVANSEMYQAAVGGAINIGTFVWWLWRNKKA